MHLICGYIGIAMKIGLRNRGVWEIRGKNAVFYREEGDNFGFSYQEVIISRKEGLKKSLLLFIMFSSSPPSVCYHHFCTKNNSRQIIKQQISVLTGLLSQVWFKKEFYLSSDLKECLSVGLAASNYISIFFVLWYLLVCLGYPVVLYPKCTQSNLVCSLSSSQRKTLGNEVACEVWIFMVILSSDISPNWQMIEISFILNFQLYGLEK